MLKTFYKGLPEPVRRSVENVYSKTPFPYRLGLDFSKFYFLLNESQWMDGETLKEIQAKRFEKIIKHAYKNVPYYNHLFKDHSLDYRDISINEINEIPILTKDIFRENWKNMIAKKYKRFFPKLLHTSGSTGEPLEYYLDRRQRKLYDACVWRHYKWCGIKNNDKIAVFRGALIDDFDKHVKIKRFMNQYHFSTFEMNEKVLKEYVNLLNGIKPNLIRGYPSSLYILCDYIIKNKISLKFIPAAIHTSSEIILPEHRLVIENALKSKLFDCYGHGEQTIFAAECEKHNGLHIFPEAGYSELIKTNESKDIKDTFNLVSTSLWNFSMPFIRYDTEDLAVYSGKKCSCGRNTKLLDSIVGRSADILIGENGSKMSPSSLHHFWKNKILNRLIGIKHYQVIQISKKKFIVKLLSQNKVDEIFLKKNMINLFGKIDIEIVYLDDLPTGIKWRNAISMI